MSKRKTRSSKITDFFQNKSTVHAAKKVKMEASQEAEIYEDDTQSRLEGETLYEGCDESDFYHSDDDEDYLLESEAKEDVKVDKIDVENLGTIKEEGNDSPTSSIIVTNEVYSDYTSDSEDELSNNESLIEEKFKCSKCCRSLKSAKMKKQHERIHTKQGFKSIKCQGIFKTEHSRDLHDTQYHLEYKKKMFPNFTCPHCCQKFKQKKALIRHLELHADAKSKVKFKSVCSGFFKTESSQLYHDKNHHPPQYEEVSKLKTKSICNTVIEKDVSGLQCPYCCSILSRSVLLAHIKNQHSNERDKQVKCNYCDGYFNDKAGLYLHISKWHYLKIAETSSNTFQCPDCLYSHKNIHQFMKHIKVFHSETEGEFVCEICNSKLKSSRQKDYHLQRHHKAREKGFKCKFCAKILDCRNSLAKHEKTHPESEHHQEKRPILPGYIKKADLYKDKGRHKMPVNSEKNFKCEKCCVVVQTEYMLAAHMTSHPKDNEPGKKCEFCGGIFHNKNYHRHVKFNHTNPLLKCTLSKFCSYETRDKRHFDRHQKNHTGIDSGTVLCDDCPAKFKTTTNLKVHKKDHHGKSHKHRCNFCGFMGHGPDAEERLKKHLEDHEKVESLNIKCRYCSIYFRSRPARHTHEVKIHGHDPADYKKVVYECEVQKCNFTGQSKQQYDEHKLVHQNNKGDFQCKICETKFTVKIALFNHMKNCHKEEKHEYVSYECKVSKCEFRTIGKTNFQAHEKMHENREGDFECQICGAKLTREIALINHMKGCHKSKGY